MSGNRTVTGISSHHWRVRGLLSAITTHRVICGLKDHLHLRFFHHVKLLPLKFPLYPALSALLVQMFPLDRHLSHLAIPLCKEFDDLQPQNGAPENTFQFAISLTV